MTLAADTATIAALITAFVAVLGLVVTAVFNQLNRRDSLREREEVALHEASKRLASHRASERAAAMAAVVEHLDHGGTAAAARRIALNALHYESEPLVIQVAVDEIVNSGQELEATAELAHLNRHLWRGFFEAFGRVLAGARRDEQYLSAELEKLVSNQAIVSRLVDGRTVRGVDFSHTFYPRLWAPEVGFVGCNFSSVLMHYANLRGARFEDCILDRSILIGAYLEDATFVGGSRHDVVTIGARLHGPTRAPASSSDALLDAPNGLVTSFLYEFEQDSRGRWTAGADEDRFDATWWNGSDTIRAEVVFRDSTFERKQSTDGNDGVYKVDLTVPLDEQHQVLLIGGTRRLENRVPSVWRAVWWKEPDPMNARPS